RSSDPPAGKPAAPAAGHNSAKAAGAATATQVSLQTAGAEASLVARVNGLTREEKAKLRAELLELLSRHGFGAATLRLNGEVETASLL
ncbi:MAG: hypothetical protein M3177_08175, partial [Pseudomonadota bacterium]|nr:hypothetical protein [Pseudomonadota bacterium]